MANGKRMPPNEILPPINHCLLNCSDNSLWFREQFPTRKKGMIQQIVNKSPRPRDLIKNFADL